MTKLVTEDRAGREYSLEEIAYRVGLSATTIRRILKKLGFKKVKPTRKPGLIKEQRTARLQFAEDHKHWALEDWKNLIWSDEMSVILGHRRGAVRVWRLTSERSEKTVVRRRWEGASYRIQRQFINTNVRFETSLHVIYSSRPSTDLQARLGWSVLPHEAL